MICHCHIISKKYFRAEKSPSNAAFTSYHSEILKEVIKKIYTLVVNTSVNKVRVTNTTGILQLSSFIHKMMNNKKTFLEVRSFLCEGG